MRDFKKDIKVRTVLLIDATGNNLGVVETKDAYKIAESVGLDLVQVGDGKNGVPVCKIMDHGKWKYEESKKHKASKTIQQITKELKIRPNTSDYDIGYRAKQAMEFIMEGNRVKILVKFKGRERNHMAETGKKALEKFLALMDQTKYKVEKAIEITEREISITLVPVKSTP